MPAFSRGAVVLVRYPFSDLSNFKVRPAVVISPPGDIYDDLFVVPLTSRTQNLSEKEFVLGDWADAGLNVQTAVKRGLLLVDSDVILKPVGVLSAHDLEELQTSVKHWLGL